MDTLQNTLPIVGDPLTGLNAKSADFMLQEFKWAVAQESAEIVLRRVDETPEVIIDLPDICPPEPLEVIQINFDIEPKFQINWEAPPIECAQLLPASYEVWGTNTAGGAPTTFLAEVTALTYTTANLSPGGYGTYLFAVYSKSASGVLSVARVGSIINEETENA